MENFHVLIPENQYEEIYDAYSFQIYRLCLFRLSDEDKAKNITQQTFYNLYQKLDEVEMEFMLSNLIHEALNLIEASNS